YLSKFAKSITIIHRRDSLRATKILQERLLSYSNISVVYNSVPKEVIGKDVLEKIKIANVKTNQIEEIKTDGVFVFIGLLPNTDFLTNITLDDKGYIVTDENMNTSITGIFACGDVRKKHLRQVVTAASDGALAAVSAGHYIETL
ncbi:MAG: NAD(P)/FAD-dependent oxidoreductase, partial [Endomicrobium sp.]|nr:NAD(P)/FAD-dependent oxidoreductase [Endomicrobium sp.]